MKATTSRRGTARWQWAVVIVAIGLVYASTPSLPVWPGNHARAAHHRFERGRTADQERGKCCRQAAAREGRTHHAQWQWAVAGTGFYVWEQASFRGAQCAADATRSTAA